MIYQTLIEKNCKQCNNRYRILAEWLERDKGLCLDCLERPTRKKDSPLEIVIKPEELNVEDNNIQIKKLPKPQNLAEYIGQETNKKSVRTAIKIIKEVYPINLFLYGLPGCGKTALSEVIANELDANFIYSIPEQLKDLDKIAEILNQIQRDERLTVWMLDECHQINRKLIDVLLPVLQDHKLGNTKIREFVLIAATTDYNKLHKKSEALISRFQTKIFLERYTIEELVLILKQYTKKLRPDFQIPEEDYLSLAQNSKGIPREAINLLLKRFVIQDVSDIFQEAKIVQDGLNQKDIQILRALNNITKPIGSNFLSQRVGLLEDDYKQVYEPFLVETNLIERTNRGRIISEKGRQFLKEVK